MKSGAQKSEEKTKRVVLLDSHAILHRAYHALPDFTSPDGAPTGALYGLSALILKIANELSPEHIIATYDLPEPTHRHLAYAHYKAGRAKIDDALIAQIERSREVFEAFSIPVYEKPGFEADDLLGTLAKQLKKEKNLQTVIASGDMDTLQLVEGNRTVVYTLKKGIQDTIIYDETGVVERYGFAPELLPDFKGLRGDPSDNIIGVPGIGEKTATILIRTFGSLEKMYATLKKGDEPFRKAGITPRIINLLTEHKEEALFSKALATIHRDVPVDFQLPPTIFTEAVDWQKVGHLFETLGFKSLLRRIGLDTAFAPPPSVETRPQDESRIERAAIGVWLLDSERTNPTLEDVYRYANTRVFDDAEKTIEADVAREGLGRVYAEIEIPLMPVLKGMREHGVLIDRVYLGELSKTYSAKLAVLEERVHEAAGESFNINSPKQLGAIIYDKLGLSAGRIKKTETGAKSTRESELVKLAHLHPIIGAVLEYREVQKLLSTYIETIPHQLDAHNRLHATLLQAGTTTGRMASEHPNLQNIPIKSELGRAIRGAFIAPPGHVLAAFDYSQIELRIAAILSEDEKLISIFTSGEDIHTAVAAEVFGVAKEAVDSEMRRKAKVINFGILYGMGVTALMGNLGGTRTQAQEFLDAYFVRFPRLAAYLEETKQYAAETGTTRTLFGRKRRFPDINSKLPYLKAAAQRMAINAPIQGTQADLIKIAMVRIDQWLRDAHAGAMIMQVHDELIFEIATDRLTETANVIKECMQSVFTQEQAKGVPIIVGASAGPNWNAMESIF
jgi:DNA polymerase-1